ncbi:SDR family oxidoreductase [bacterium]|nr:MAG: SDR family oxidoreductase [bacterium]
MAWDLKGKTVVVTGATNGIGKAAAVELGRRGARLVLVGRDRRRCADAADAVRATGVSVDTVVADLSLMSETRRAAAEVLALCPRLDVLVNNAGAIMPERRMTAEGHEATLALNHLSYFLFTKLLTERLKASAPARVVVVASDAHRSAAGFPFDDLKAEKRFVPMLRYGETKLANILFTRALAKRLAGSGVTANALHPGVVATGFGADSKGIVGLFVRLARPFLLTAEQGAETIVHLAASPEAEGVSGRYFAKSREKAPRPPALDDAAAERLWALSEELTA